MERLFSQCFLRIVEQRSETDLCFYCKRLARPAARRGGFRGTGPRGREGEPTGGLGSPRGRAGEPTGGQGSPREGRGAHPGGQGSPHGRAGEPTWEGRGAHEGGEGSPRGRGGEPTREGGEPTREGGEPTREGGESPAVGWKWGPGKRSLALMGGESWQ